MAKGFAADLREPEDVAALVDGVAKSFGGIDIVVSNAGTHVAGRLAEIDSDKLLSHFKTKVLGAWELARRVTPIMQKRGGGRFIFIIGQAGKVPQANAIASTVVNAAQHAFVKSLSDDLAPHGILVNAVCPSRIKSPLTDRLRRCTTNLITAAAWSSRNRNGAPRCRSAIGARRRTSPTRSRSWPRRAPATSSAPISTSTAATSARSSEGPAMIELRHVSKIFRKRDVLVDAVRDIDVTIAPKEIVAVIGPSGCGKSTLLNMIAGLYTPSGGAIVYKGTRVTDVNTDVGYMTQKDNLLPWRTCATTSPFRSSWPASARPSVSTAPTR